jgi:hypothetical protein
MLREEYSPRRSRSKGGSLTMLRDAGALVAALLISGQRKPHRQTAAAALLSAAERGGIMMLAEIAMRRPLGHGRPQADAEEGGEDVSSSGSALDTARLGVSTDQL